MPDLVLLKCFSGCSLDKILRSLSMSRRDLFLFPRSARAVIRPKIIAIYPYRDETGRLIAEKVRGEGKVFWWRSPDPSRDGRLTLGLHGGRPVLYRAERLAGCAALFVVEGEKAVDRVAQLGLRAVCAPYGASRWNPEQTETLCRHTPDPLIILPDEDKPGYKHAQAVAMACFQWGQEHTDETATMTIKVVKLPGLVAGGDIVDWLDAGHTEQELWEQVGSAPVWTPSLASELRRIRQRENGCARQRRFRARRSAQRSIVVSATES